jgi:hypothetical protein
MFLKRASEYGVYQFTGRSGHDEKSKTDIFLFVWTLLILLSSLGDALAVDVKGYCASSISEATRDLQAQNKSLADRVATMTAEHDMTLLNLENLHAQLEAFEQGCGGKATAEVRLRKH